VNSQPITVTTTVAVWLANTEYSGRPQDLVDALAKGDAIRVVNLLQFYGEAGKEKFCDYIKVGEADITLRLISRDEQTRMALEALNAQLQKLRAAYMERQQEILTQISNLQALPCEVSA
jgi:hypothetical protein